MTCVFAMSDDGAPAYDLNPWRNKKRSTRGPQCSQFNEFCFMCQFNEGKDPDDVYGVLVETITQLVKEGKEISTIAQVVQHNYDANIRGDIVYVDPETGLEIESPPWTRDSITRHILFSKRWPELIEDICEAMLVGVITNINEYVIGPDGRVREEDRKALCDTIDRFAKLRRGRQKGWK